MLQGFILDRSTIKTLRPGDIVEIQLRVSANHFLALTALISCRSSRVSQASYLNLPRSDPGVYLQSSFQSWAWVSAYLGGPTKHSISNDSITFRRRWLKAEAGELVGWKSIEDGHVSRTPLLKSRCSDWSLT